MNKKQIRNLVGNTIFSVEFTKKDGTLRKMLCRLGVTKHLKGGISKNNKENDLIVYSLDSKGYRTVNLDTLELVKAKGKVINL